MSQPDVNDIASVAEALALAKAELDGAEDVLRGFVEDICNRLSLQRGEKEWYRISSESRVKDPLGVARALKETDSSVNDIWDIDDLVGARAVVLRRSDVTSLADAILAAEHIPLIDALGDVKHDEITGYRALHVKGWMEAGGRRIGCEIQLRTELQDAFAVVSRLNLYKTAVAPPEIVVRTARMQSDHLAVIDEAFELVREFVDEHQISKIEAKPVSDAPPQEIVE